jgi:hypothetical protein
VADGEGQETVEAYRSFLDARALDMLQGDMYLLNIEGTLGEGAMARPHGILVALVTGSSLLFLFMLSTSAFSP